MMVFIYYLQVLTIYYLYNYWHTWTTE